VFGGARGNRVVPGHVNRRHLRLAAASSAGLTRLSSLRRLAGLRRLPRLRGLNRQGGLIRSRLMNVLSQSRRSHTERTNEHNRKLHRVLLLRPNQLMCRPKNSTSRRPEPGSTTNAETFLALYSVEF
jgi:hypothetical protein